MYLISAVLPIFSLICFKLGSCTVFPDQVKIEVDGNAMLDEHIVDMNPENMKLIDKDFKDSLYFDENNLDEQLAESQKMTSAMTNLIVIIIAIVLSVAIFSSILIILCRKYGFCKKKKWCYRIFLRFSKYIFGKYYYSLFLYWCKMNVVFRPGNAQGYHTYNANRFGSVVVVSIFISKIQFLSIFFFFFFHLEKLLSDLIQTIRN